MYQGFSIKRRSFGVRPHGVISTPLGLMVGYQRGKLPPREGGSGVSPMLIARQSGGQPQEGALGEAAPSSPARACRHPDRQALGAPRLRKRPASFKVDQDLSGGWP